MRVHGRLVLGAVVLTGFLSAPAFMAQPARAQVAQTQTDWLPLCGKCQKPVIISKSGIGTAHAVAKARVTYEGAKAHCENWQMASTPDCDKDAKETMKEEAGKVYKATADCVRGKLTDTTDDSFTYAGLWSSGYIKGETRWRWASGYDAGKIVGMDWPVGAPMVAQTSAILCPHGIGARGHHR